MKGALLFIGVLVCVYSHSAWAAVGPLETIIEEWETWKLEFGKDYSGDPGEEVDRIKIWMENKARIERHNREFLEGKHSYTLRMNHFGDFLPEEHSRLRGHIPIKDSDSTGIETFKKPKYIGDVPDSWDWMFAVTPVKYQGTCGSCWAFAAIAALEVCSTYAAGSDVILSEQNIIDCNYDGAGCAGGNVVQAFKYVQENGGVDTEASYPYEDEDDTCSYSPDNVGATVKKFQRIEEGDEEAMKVALAKYGPLTASLFAGDENGDGKGFYNWLGEGIYDDDNNECEGKETNHAVLIVGYGTDEDTGMDYWLIKNSWGTSWGDNGYIKLKRNTGGMGLCGIASYVHQVFEY